MPKNAYELCIQRSDGNSFGHHAMERFSNPMICDMVLRMTIDERNRLRTEAGLPPLDVQKEAARLATVEWEASFERYCQQNRDRFTHWIDEGQGWLSRMGRWSRARQLLRLEFEALNSN